MTPVNKPEPTVALQYFTVYHSWCSILVILPSLKHNTAGCFKICRRNTSTLIHTDTA